MSYITQSLAPGERILVQGRWPAIFWIGAWLALIVLGIAIVGVFIFIRAAVVMSTTKFAVTDQRVILKRGWLNRRTQELAVESVEGVHLDQSLWGRMFGFGRLIVTGTGDAVIVFPAMAEPVAFRRAIESARVASKEVRLSGQDVERVAAANAEEPVEVVDETRVRPVRKRSFLGLMSN